MRRLLLTCLIGGCTPVIPFHLAETAETLKSGGVSLTVAGGGGGGRDVHGCCGGGAVRVSFGTGEKMEVGLEVAVVGGDPANHEVSILGKLRYKWGFHKNLALLAGIGGTGVIDTRNSSGRAGIGGDLGLVWSTDTLAKVVRIYGGGRFSFVFAAGERDFYGAGGPTQAFIVPVGVAFLPTHGLRLYVEGGLTGGWSENRANDNLDPQVYRWIGGYGLLAIAYAWNS